MVYQECGQNATDEATDGPVNMQDVLTCNSSIVFIWNINMSLIYCGNVTPAPCLCKTNISFIYCGNVTQAPSLSQTKLFHLWETKTFLPCNYVDKHQVCIAYNLSKKKLFSGFGTGELTHCRGGWVGGGGKRICFAPPPHNCLDDDNVFLPHMFKFDLF